MYKALLLQAFTDIQWDPSNMMQMVISVHAIFSNSKPFPLDLFFSYAYSKLPLFPTIS